MSSLILEVKDKIAKITLNRPEAFNSVNAALGEELIRALDECAENEEVSVIILTGAGKAFCAGQDLKEVTNPETHPGFRDLLEKRYEPIVTRLKTIDKPIIAAVNGVAAGAGANFALACDIIVASETASFIQAFSAIGLIPDSGGTFTLPRTVGLAKAKALTMLGEKVSAEEAERMGMIYNYFPEDTFPEEVKKIAHKLAELPIKGLAFTKRVMNLSLANSFEQQLKIETELQIAAASTEDHQEAVKAFVEKRKPKFKGQ